MSIINLKKTIEGMKMNDEMMYEKLKKEIEIINNKLWNLFSFSNYKFSYFYNNYIIFLRTNLN